MRGEIPLFSPYILIILMSESDPDLVYIDAELVQELQEYTEDIVSLWCNDNIKSGELAWAIIECLAQAKQAELQGMFDE